MNFNGFLLNLMVIWDKVTEKSRFYTEKRVYFLFLTSYYYIYIVLYHIDGPTFNKRVKFGVLQGIGRGLRLDCTVLPPIPRHSTPFTHKLGVDSSLFQGIGSF